MGLVSADKHWVEIFTLHSTALYVNLNGLVYDASNVGATFSYKGYAGKFKYLTFWCQILQLLYFSVCVLNDLFGSNTRPASGGARTKSLPERFRDYFLAAVAFPLGSFVVITFWALYAVDRELVFPKVLDAIIPCWLNHVMHTLPLPLLLLDKYFVYHEYPPRSKGIMGTVVFSVLYQVWVLWIAYRADLWVYPVLSVLGWPGRLAFFAALWVLMISLYLVGERLTNSFWCPKKVEKKVQ